MKKHFIFKLIIALSLLMVADKIHATTILPGQGLKIYQLDLTYPGASLFDSPYGLAVVDFNLITTTTGISPGYLNIITSEGWVVRNMPIDLASGYGGMSTMFNLGSNGNIDSLLVLADLSSSPTINFLGSPSEIYNVGSLENNAQGAGGIRLFPPLVPIDASILAFLDFALTQKLWQFVDRKNIEQDNNQCGPASVANSLAWLKKTKGLAVPHTHEAGIANNSLVGQLDSLMNRNQGEGVTANEFLNGKVQYLGNNGLQTHLSIKHKNSKNGSNLLPNNNVTMAGVTSKANTDTTISLINWIISEIAHGEDVEIWISWDGGGAHLIDLTGAGKTKGVPWISWVHDANQGASGGTSWLEGGVGWSQVVNNKIVSYIPGLMSPATIEFAASESYDPPMQQYIITNNTGMDASDLHITFSGTGGDLFGEVIASPMGCPNDTIPSNCTVTNTLGVDWGVACIPNGQSVTVKVSSVNGPIDFAGGYWTGPNNQTDPGIGPIETDDITEVSLIPPLPPWCFSGTAEGGAISVSIDGPDNSCSVGIITNEGESAETVSSNLVTAINNDGCLSSQGITAELQGNCLIINGGNLTEDDISTTISDAGLEHFIIPTLSQWGLILLIMFLLTLSTVAILRRQSILAGANTTSNSKTPLFEPRLFWKTLPKVLLFVPLVLLLFYFAYGFITTADIFGTLLSAGIIAYLIHFILLSNNNID